MIRRYRGTMDLWASVEKRTEDFSKYCHLRYMSIIHPLTPRLTTRHTLLVVLIIWIISLLICTPDVALINFSQTKNGPQCYVGKERGNYFIMMEHF